MGRRWKIKVKENICSCQVANIHACATPSSIRLFIEIPLKGNDKCFKVFRPHLLPYYDDEIKEIVSIRMPMEDRQLLRK